MLYGEEIQTEEPTANDLLPNLVRPIEAIANSMGVSSVNLRVGFNHGWNSEGSYNPPTDTISVGVPVRMFEEEAEKRVIANPKLIAYLSNELIDYFNGEIRRIRMSDSVRSIESRLLSVEKQIEKVRQIAEGVALDSLEHGSAQELVSSLVYLLRMELDSAFFDDEYGRKTLYKSGQENRVVEVGLNIMAGIESTDEYFEKKESTVKHEIGHSILTREIIFPHYTQTEVGRFFDMERQVVMQYIGRFEKQFPNALPRISRDNLDEEVEEVEDLTSFLRCYEKKSKTTELQYAVRVFALKDQGVPVEDIYRVLHLSYVFSLQEIYLVIVEAIKSKVEFTLKDFLTRIGNYCYENGQILPSADFMKEVVKNLVNYNDLPTALQKVREFMEYENFERFLDQSYLVGWLKDAGLLGEARR